MVLLVTHRRREVEGSYGLAGDPVYSGRAQDGDLGGLGLGLGLGRRGGREGGRRGEGEEGGREEGGGR